MSYRGGQIYESSAIISRRELGTVYNIGQNQTNISKGINHDIDNDNKKVPSNLKDHIKITKDLSASKQYILSSVYVMIMNLFHFLRIKLASLRYKHPDDEDINISKEVVPENVDNLQEDKSPVIIQDSESDLGDDNNSSLILLEECGKPFNVFSTLLDIDHCDESADAHSSYGTSLSAGISSNYVSPYGGFLKSSSSIKNPELPHLLEVEPRTNDYDKEVLSHYLPNKPISALNYSIIDTLLSTFHIDKISDVYERERQNIQNLFNQERTKEETGIKALSGDELSKVLNIWKSKTNSLIVSNFQIDIFVRDLKTLDDRNWLNDNIIDYYFNLITSSNENVYGWTTHFFTTLQAKGYQGVARWARRRKVDLTKKDLILVPINIMETHWALAVINNQDKSFGYYDSLASSGNINALRILKDYMINEGKRLNSNINFQSYEMHPSIKTPQQKNGYDCGVFTCTCARYISNSLPLTYSQNDMKVIRRRMAYEIIQNKIIP